MSSFFQELKRRKVFRVAAVYAVVAWLLIQVADVVLPTFGAPTWVNQTLIFLFIIGFPVAVILSWAYEATPDGVKPDALVEAAPARQATSAQPVNYLILVVVLLVAGFQVTDRVLMDTSRLPLVPANNSTTEPFSYRNELNLGNLEQRPQAFGSYTSRFDLADDGRTLVYNAYEDGVYRLYRRDLNQLESRVLVESQVAMSGGPLSPDDEWVAYYNANGELHIQSVAGGTPRLIGSSVTGPNNFNWLDENKLIYAGREGAGTGWYRMAITNDESSPVIVSSSSDGTIKRTPWPLPDGKGVLFAEIINQPGGNSWVSHLDLETGVERRLITDAYAPKYVVTGHLLFMRGDDLWAVPFDYENVRVTGSEHRMIAGIENTREIASYAVSQSGLLAYLRGGRMSREITTRLTWVDSSGNEEFLDLPAQTYADPEISPDGRRLSIGIVQPGGAFDIWVHNLSQPGILNRVTRSETALNGIWSPDGQSLIYTDISDQSLRQTGASGVGTAQELLVVRQEVYARDFTPDGGLLFDQGFSVANADIRLFQATDIETPDRPVLATELWEAAPAVSADGRLLAYVSDETGSPEVYVRPFPQVNANKWRISVNRGHSPQWDPKGNVLHYMTPDDVLVSAEIQLEPEFMVARRSEFPTADYYTGNTPAFAVDPNSDRFLFMKFTDKEASLRAPRDGSEPVLMVLVHNWFEELNRLVPPDSQ